MKSDIYVVYIDNGILFSHEEGNPAICDRWMDLEGIMLSEISQTEKDKYSIYMWNPRNREQSGGYQELGGRGNEDNGQRAQTSSYKMKKFQGSKVQHGNYSHSIVLYT